MNISITLASTLIALTLVLGGCDKSKNIPPSTTPSQTPTTTPKSTELPEGKADQEENEATTPTAPPSTKPAVDPVPVPAAQLPKSNPRDVPEVDPLGKNGAIATNFKTPDISGTIMPYLIANRQSLGSCGEFAFDPELARNSSNVYRMGENTYLVHFVCTTSAYQILQEYYLYENTNDKPVVSLLKMSYFYADLNGELVQATERTLAGFSDYDPDTQTISIFTKGRGLGDCGSVGFYKFTGKELRLERFLAKNECDGNYIDPINYPQVYP